MLGKQLRRLWACSSLEGNLPHSSQAIHLLYLLNWAKGLCLSSPDLLLFFWCCARGKWTEKQKATSRSCSVYTRPLSIPWVFDTEFILGLQAAKANAEHRITSQVVGFCLWLSVSVLFIKEKAIYWTSYCLHTWAEATGSWPDGEIHVCLFLCMEHDPALQHVCSFIALTSWNK